MTIACRYTSRAGIVLCELADPSGQRDEFRVDLDPSSWVDLGQGYAKDAMRVVMNADVIEGADAASFEVLAGGYAKDTVLGEHYAADAKTVFYYLNDDGVADLAELWPLPGVSPDDFEVLTGLDPGYARTRNAIVNHGAIETAVADPEGFESLQHGFARDRLHVYELRPKLREIEGTPQRFVQVRVPIVVEGARPDIFVVP